jgi:hypothetical protein
MNNALIPPSTLVVCAFGGVRPIARLLNCEPSTVSRWSKTGRVPSYWQKIILELAWSKNIDLTAHDVIFGREAL